MDTTTSNWTTNKRYHWASRKDAGLTLVLHRGKWCLLEELSGPLTLYASDSLATAILEADRRYPPEGWGYVVGMWVSNDWYIKPEGEGWMIYDKDKALKSTHVFARADLARKWCEIRQDRVGLRLRGPKPKVPPVGA
jgi:hypothetical protein